MAAGVCDMAAEIQEGETYWWLLQARLGLQRLLLMLQRSIFGLVSAACISMLS